MPNARRFAFTLNNPKDHGGKQLKEILTQECTYVIIGYEYAPDTGTPHYQGYCVFRDPKSGKQLKQMNNSVHWEVAHKCHTTNVTYCSKKSVKKPFIVNNNHQGHRSDLDSIAEQLQEGASLYDVSRIHPSSYIRNYKGIESWYTMRSTGPVRPRQTKPIVRWYYGPAGSGKTRTVYEDFVPDEIYTVDNWRDWTGYVGQKCILIDDFRGDDNNGIPFNTLLRLLDRYPIRMNVKFGSTQIDSPNIIVTTPYHPNATFPAGEDMKQLTRRIDEIRRFDNFPNQEYWKNFQNFSKK